jgi:hypothetical protein
MIHVQGSALKAETATHNPQGTTVVLNLIILNLFRISDFGFRAYSSAMIEARGEKAGRDNSFNVMYQNLL